MALSKEWYDAEFVDSESESLHRAPSIEYSFYNAVKTGDMEYVIKNCKEDAFIHLDGTGVLSRNTLQNIKYHFVVTTAMITRYCIDGGLEPEQAYRLSDFYILKESAGRLQILRRLLFRAALRQIRFLQNKSLEPVCFCDAGIFVRCKF